MWISQIKNPKPSATPPIIDLQAFETPKTWSKGLGASVILQDFLDN
jgi:hypothetical protein